jgi:type IV pilus assembly protein PilN
MIRVNLLPIKRKKKPKPVPTFIVAALFLALGAAILGVGASVFLGSRIEALEQQKKANARKIAELDKKIAEVKGYEKLNRTFTQRKHIIEQLRHNQSLPARVLDEMAQRLSNGVWLTAARISGNKVNISGVGFSNADIVNYVQSMKDSALFTNVTLLESVKATLSGVAAYKFKMTFGIVKETNGA